MNYSRITAEAGMVMKNPPVTISPSGRVPGRASEPSRDGFGVDGGYGTLRGFLLGCLWFSRGGEYMGEVAESEAARGAHTWARRGPRAARAWALSGPHRPLLHFVFWLRESSGEIGFLMYFPGFFPKVGFLHKNETAGQFC